MATPATLSPSHHETTTTNDSSTYDALIKTAHVTTPTVPRSGSARMVSIIGNIAAGKTSAIGHLLREHPGLYVHARELTGPVMAQLHEYYELLGRRDTDDDNMALLSKAALALQVSFLCTRIGEAHRCQEVCRAGDARIVVSDRDAFTDCFAFPFMLYRDGILSEKDFTAYQTLWRSTVDAHPALRPDVIVYLRTRPATARARKVKRDSQAERAMDAVYQERVHDQHEHMARFLREYLKMHVVVVDTDNMTEKQVADAVHEAVEHL